MYMIALYITSWFLSGSFLSGVLAVSFYVLNRWNIFVYYRVSPIKL